MSGDEVLESASARLVEFSSTVALDELPSRLRELAVDAIASLTRGASAGHQDGRVRAIDAASGEVGPGSEASVFGGDRRRRACLAAALNAAAARAGGGAEKSTARGLADVVAAAALATAQRDHVAPNELLAGIAVGLEVAHRVAAALGPSHLGRGWWLAGTAGRVGAAVAAARVDGLAASAHLAAMGLAATQAAGIGVGAAGTAAVLVAGRVAHDAVEAATIAAAGLLGDPLPLEGRRGLLALTSDNAHRAVLTDGLRVHWRATVAADPIVRDELFTRAQGLADHHEVERVVAALGAATT